MKRSIQEAVKDKNIVQKIVLCDVQKEIFPEIEKALLNLLHNSGYPDVKFFSHKNLSSNFEFYPDFFPDLHPDQ